FLYQIRAQLQNLIWTRLILDRNWRRAPDGVPQAADGIIEGRKIPGYPKILGVQWHPEKDLQANRPEDYFPFL
ncbi:MAG: gamma-glutamyl-gamma-aminobutyrate hydrolase family protein, partial [Thermodesulfobacteriota bacterium]